MQPSDDPDMPTRPLPIAQVHTGMTVVDSAGDEVGTVTEVRMPGTGHAEVPDHQAGALRESGFVRIAGHGLLAADHYAAGSEVYDVITTDDGVVTLTVRKDDLRRAG